MKKIRIVLLVFVLSGCASFSGYDGMIETYHGIPESELIRTWGIPSKIYESKDSRFLIYSKSDKTMFGFENEKIVCKTTFKIQDKKVESSAYEGSQCQGWGKDKYDLSKKHFNPPD